MTDSAYASRCGVDGSGFLRADVHAPCMGTCSGAGDGVDHVPRPAHRAQGCCELWVWRTGRRSANRGLGRNGTEKAVKTLEGLI